MPTNATRFKSGKGKSIRIDKLNAQKRKDVKSKINHYKSIGLVTLAFLLSITFLLSFFIYRNFNQHFASASSYENYTIDYPTTTYYVVQDLKANPLVLKKLVFTVLDKTNSTLYLFEIPINVEIDISAKYSDITFSKLFMLGGVSNEDKVIGGVDLVNKNIFKLFGFNVNNYVVVDQSREAILDKLFYTRNSVFPFGGLSPRNMSDYFITNYNLKDFYQFQMALNSVSAENLFIKSLDPTQLKDTSSLDDYFINMTLSSRLSREKKTISVLNGTNLSGVATLCSRVINNMGGRVVGIENSMSPYEESMLVVDDINSETVSYIKNVFNVKKIYTKEQASFLKEDALNRSDIVLFIGFDLGEVLY